MHSIIISQMSNESNGSLDAECSTRGLQLRVLYFPVARLLSGGHKDRFDHTSLHMSK